MEKEQGLQNYHNFIKQQFERRKKQNPNFSLRSFARWLQISPAQASQLISGKRRLSKKMATQIADKLNLSPYEKIEFLDSLDPDLITQRNILSSDDAKLQLQEDEFNLIADWPHYSILSLSETQNPSSDPRWIAQRLGIDVTTARECFDRLKRLKLIKINKDQSYSQTHSGLKTSKDILSKAIQKHHTQNLSLAQQKLEQVEPLQREFSSITMAINPKKVKQAKVLINDFKRKLCALLEEGEKQEVYTLSIQLFPNTVLKGDKKND